jgi:hypothetical protein
MKRTRFSILDLLILTALAAVTFACFRLDLGIWGVNFLFRCIGSAALIAAFFLAFRRAGFREAA